MNILENRISIEAKIDGIYLHEDASRLWKEISYNFDVENMSNTLNTFPNFLKKFNPWLGEITSVHNMLDDTLDNFFALRDKYPTLRFDTEFDYEDDLQEWNEISWQDERSILLWKAAYSIRNGKNEAEVFEKLLTKIESKDSVIDNKKFNLSGLSPNKIELVRNLVDL